MTKIKVFKNDEYIFEHPFFVFEFARGCMKLMYKKDTHCKIRVNSNITFSLTTYILQDNGRQSFIKGGYLGKFSRNKPYEIIGKHFFDYSTITYYYYLSLYKLKDIDFNFNSNLVRFMYENGRLYVLSRGVKEEVSIELLFDIYNALTRHRYFKGGGFLVTTGGIFKGGEPIDDIDLIVFGDMLLYDLDKIFLEKFKVSNSITSEFGSVD